MWLILSFIILFEILRSSAINGQLNCYDGWTNVLQTGSDGSVVTGSKRALKDAILKSADLQVYIPDWNYATSTQKVSVVNNSNDICAQAIFHISKDSWKTFLQDAHWYLLLICTTGHIGRSIRHVGSDSRPSSIETPSESTSHLPIVWFVRSSINRPVYCNSDNDTQTCGSLTDLENAMIHGADIRIVNGGYSPISAVIERNGLVVGEYLWTVGTDNIGDHEAFQKETFWWVTLQYTFGILVKSKWSFQTNTMAEKNSTQIQTPMKWFADTCWALTYKHDSEGKAIDGSLHFLRSAIKDGHRLKRVLLANPPPNLSIETNNIVLRSTDVSGQMGFFEGSVWQWIQFSTSGNADGISYNRNGQVIERSFNDSLDVTIVSWYIDTRHWEHVLTTSEIGIATFGSKSVLLQYVRKGYMLRCNIHFSADHILAAQADNVEISPDGTNIGAQILRVISYTTEGTSSRHLKSVPYWKFTIATTEGTSSQSEWMVGNHTLGVTNCTSAVIDWFVN